MLNFPTPPYVLAGSEPQRDESGAASLTVGAQETMNSSTEVTLTPELMDLSVFGRKRILIIDPDGANCRRITEAIDNNRMAYETADSIVAARAKIDEFSPHIILVGVESPEDVIETLARLQFDTDRVQYITMSQPDNRDVGVVSFRHGAADHITKPVDVLQLNNALYRALCGYRKDVELVRLRSIVANNTLPITLLDKDGRIESCNTAYNHLFGYEEGDVLGKTPRFLRVGESTVDTLSQMWGAISSGNAWEGEVSARVKDNQTNHLDVVMTPLEDSYGEVDGYVVHLATLSDLQSMGKARDTEAVQSRSYDEATGSSSEEVFKKRIVRILSTIAQAPSKPSLAIISLWGLEGSEPHQQRLADVILKKLNQAIEDKTHNIALVGRLSKTELGAVFPHMKVEGCHDLLRLICQKLDEAIRKVKDTQAIDVAFKVGVAEMQSEEISVDDYIDLTRQLSISIDEGEAAAAAVIKDLSSGSSDSQKSPIDPTLETILKAMNEGWLRLASQKIAPVDNPFDKTTMMEMLLRIAIPDGPIMTSAQFLEVAEQHGLAIELDKWVIQQAVQWLTDDPVRRSTVDKLFINISQATMQDAQIPRFISAVLDEAGIPGTKLCFEITEAAALAEVDRSRRLTSRLRQLGCSFALDNFCRAGVSFSMLNRVPVDYIKLDGSIVEEMLTDETSQTVVKTLTEISRSAGKEVVALRVEDTKIIQTLRDLGIQYVQGFGIEAPKVMRGIGDDDDPTLAQTA